jgi:lysophospholipase L1-like esterase
MNFHLTPSQRRIAQVLKHLHCALAFIALSLCAPSTHAAAPNLLTYQGRVVVDGVNFTGTGKFKFALVDAAGSTTYWSNDGTSTGGSVPLQGVTLGVDKGYYAVMLGDTTLANMTALSPIVLQTGDVRLRVWFDDGVHGFERLMPDQRLASAAYAMVAASVIDGVGGSTIIGRKAVLLGDSIANSLYDANGYMAHANVRLGQRLVFEKNAGVGGDTTAQMLARIERDVLAYKPNIVIFLGGTNDIGQGRSFSSVTSNMIAIWDKIRGVGARTVVGTIPPAAGRDSVKKELCNKLNDFIRRQCLIRPDLILVDHYNGLVDPSTDGEPLSGVLADGVHPSPLGASIMGRLVSDSIAPFYPNANLLNQGGSSLNLLKNSSFVGAGTTSPGFWGVSGVVPAYSYVNRTDGVSGKWFQCIAAPGTTFLIQQNVSIGGSLAIGDKVAGYVEFECDSSEEKPIAGGGVRMLMQCHNGSSFTAQSFAIYNDALRSGYPPAGHGVLYCPVMFIPDGTKIVTFVIHVVGGGTYRFARAQFLRLE